MANNYNFQPVNSQAQQFSNNQAAQAIMPNLAQNSILFPQPIGNVYNLNTANDIGNIPTGANPSVGLCLNESLLYIKTLQNGSPMLLGYKLTPLGAPTDENTSEDTEKIRNILHSFDNRFTELEKQVIRLKETVGGKKEWQQQVYGK